MEVLFRYGTSPKPSTFGIAGRHPALIKICSARNARCVPSFKRTAKDLGAGEARFAKNQIEVFSFFQTGLAAISETIDDVAFALTNSRHVDANISGFNSIIGARGGRDRLHGRWPPWSSWACSLH